MQTPRVSILLSCFAVGLGCYAVFGDAFRDRPHRGTQSHMPAGDASAGAEVRTTLMRLKADVAALHNAVEDTRELQGELDDLRAAVSALSGRSDNDSVWRDASGVADAVREAVGPPTAHDGDYDEFQRMQTMESAYLAEDVSSGWALETGDTITAFFETADLPGTHVSDVDCRSTLCRLAVRHDDIMASDDFTQQFVVHVAESLPEISYHYEQHDDGTMDVVMFLARSGHQLPRH